MCIKTKLTVFFDDPFWVGVYERTFNEKLEVSRIVFGTESKDYEVYEFLLKNWSNLKFSPPVYAENSVKKKLNPKRIQKQISAQLSEREIGTKAQQALKLQHTEGKMKRAEINRQKKEFEEQRKYELRQQKKKQKHKGR